MNSDIIIRAISKLARKKSEDIHGHLSLATLGLTKSFGLSALRSIIELESKSKLPPLNTNMTVNVLIDMMSSESVSDVMSPQQSNKDEVSIIKGATITDIPQSLPLTKNIGLGMDMQENSILPIADDYRTHEFYLTHFSSTEIATAILRPNPRAHLCGIFCAKEAAKKSHPILLNLRMSDFLVRHDSEGRPFISLIDSNQLGDKFQFILSLTHTSQFSAATCITIWGNE